MRRLGIAIAGALVAAALPATLVVADLLDSPPAPASVPTATPARVAPRPTQAPTSAAADATSARTAGPDPAVAAFADKVPADTTQVVRTISSHRWCAKVYCTVTQAWQKQADGQWRLVKQFRSSIGPRGWGKKREGDNRSPVGVFTIVTTFSTGKRPGPMPWRRRNPTTNVSDTPGPNYNTWLEQPGRTSGNRPSMRWGWWIDYNNPRLTPGKGPAPVQGKGSGIFYHTSKPGARWAPTEGCTQVGNPRSMHWLVSWLRPQADPRVVQDL